MSTGRVKSTEMAIPINKQGGRATYYYPGDGYLRRYDDFGVTQIKV